MREQRYKNENFTQSPDGNKQRYFLLTIVIILALLAILLKTTILQIRGRQWDPVSLTSGEGGRMTVKGPRGDIVDQDGRTLAYSLESNHLYLAPTSVSDRELNKELLAIAQLLRDYGVEALPDLEEYFDLSQESKDSEEENDLHFVFKKELDEIARWQQDKNLFNLSPETSTLAPRYKVKLKPQNFYDYLLYDLFAIEDKAAGGNLYYTQREAWDIMRLRYLIFVNNWTYQQGEPVKLAENIPEKLKNILSEQKTVYPGVLIKQESERRYTEDSRFFSHILGYVGKISPYEYENLKAEGYGINDITGKAGVEFTAERYLQGKPGSKAYGTWYKKEGEWQYLQGEGGIPASPGASLRLTQSLDVQKVLYASLYDIVQTVREKEIGSATSASAVMMDIKNGRVLAMGSIPSFQPNDFIAPPEDTEARERAVRDLQDTKHKPMQNRCISEIYAPGSTFKGITGQTGILEGVINRVNNRYECKGKETIGYKNWVCYGEPIYGHGMISLEEALGYSCNLYFFKLGLDTGIEAISRHCKELGLGEYSEIDLPGEAKGIRPSPEVKSQTRLTPSDQEWYPADTCQTSIGQFDNAYTLLQMVRAIGGTVSNKLVTPHVIYEIKGADGTIMRPEQVRVKDLGMPAEAVDMVREAMGQQKYYEIFNNTNRNFVDYPVNVGAKTGTAEFGYNEDFANAVFICYAPVEDPEVAICCFVEKGGKGDISSNIARDLLDAYFGFEPRPEIKTRLAELETDPEKFLLIDERADWKPEDEEKDKDENKKEDIEETEDNPEDTD